MLAEKFFIGFREIQNAFQLCLTLESEVFTTTINILPMIVQKHSF